jgi:hypothetical protein
MNSMKCGNTNRLWIRRFSVLAFASLALLCSTLLTVRPANLFAAEETTATAESQTVEAKTEKEKEEPKDEK